MLVQILDGQEMHAGLLLKPLTQERHVPKSGAAIRNRFRLMQNLGLVK